MSLGPSASGNVKEVVPFLWVFEMERSVRYYTDGLGFTIKRQWMDGGKLRWCWLSLGGAALMLQEFTREGHGTGPSAGKSGAGFSLYFICSDAVKIYDELRSRGIDASEPEVGNGMWVTSLFDPDGYKLHFESVTDAAEETRLSQVRDRRARAD